MPHPYGDRQAVSLEGEGPAPASEATQGASETTSGPPRLAPLARAAELICAERNQEYGSPYDSHERIAALWSAYLGTEVRPYDAAVMLALMKASRARTDRKLDTFVDGAAYFALAWEILLEEGE